MDLNKIIRQWYIVAIATFTVLLLIYVTIHYRVPGAEVVKLSKQELSDVNIILFGSNDTTGDSLVYNDKNKAEKTSVTAKITRQNKVRRAATYRYIFSTRKPVSKQDSTNFVKYFDDFELQQFASVLSNYPIRSKSYFWLTSPGIYMEVIFWSLFGLFASLFYYVSESVRKKEFSATEFSVHISKLFYTPLSSLIIFFSINALTKAGDIVVSEFSHSSIVLSFILGFFSGRTIELLGKIKDLILPSAKTGTDEETHVSVQETKDPVGDVSNFSALPLAQQDELIQRYIADSYLELKKEHPNLTGINAERKKIDGHAMDYLSIVFQVEKKGDEVDNQFEKIIQHNGYYIPTDVHEHGLTIPMSDNITALEGGISRLQQTAFGTIGVPVTDATGKDFLMSCYHVLFDIELTRGKFKTESTDIIDDRNLISPCYAEGGVPGIHNVGTIVEGEIGDWLDIGIFKAETSRSIASSFKKIPGPFGTYMLNRDDENKVYVQYWGNGTKKVSARKVQNIFSNQWINYVVQGSVTPKFIMGLIQLEGPSLGGDSGSPVVDGKGNYVGTIIGSDNLSTYLISARSIILKSKYKIKPLTRL